VAEIQKNDSSPSGKIFDLEILKRLFQFIKPYNAKFYTLILTIMLGASLAPALPLLIRQTIDGPVSAGDYAGLAKMMLIMIGFLIIQSFIQFTNTYLAGWLGQTSFEIFGCNFTTKSCIYA
jgi:ATP-binding cassette, subfamily B, multidrug efflux pump